MIVFVFIFLLTLIMLNALRNLHLHTMLLKLLAKLNVFKTLAKKHQDDEKVVLNQNQSRDYYPCYVLSVLMMILAFIEKNFAFGLLALLLFALPTLYIQYKTHQNRKIIEKKSSFFLDMLHLSLLAGLDILNAIEHIKNFEAQGPFHDELLRLEKNLSLGFSRQSAFEVMALRTKSKTLLTLSHMVSQSQKMGTGLGEYLDLQSKELKRQAFNTAQAKAQQISVLLLLPMLMFIFPVIFILLFTPIVISFF